MSGGQEGTGHARERSRPPGSDERRKGRLVCALEMEMTKRAISKVDCGNFDGLVHRNGGDSAEVSVPVSLHGKRGTQMEGDNLYRLRDRKFLLEDKKRLCALSLGSALLGILLMILHTEMCPFFYKPILDKAAKKNNKDCMKGTDIALIMNCSITLSTGCLLIFIIAFHYKDIRLFINDHNQVDWRIAMTSHRVFLITLELLACAIHPVGTYWEVLMNKYPARTLLVFILFFWLTASWMLTLCERQTAGSTDHMETALWLIAITFLTVGYGDVAPKTSCGKSVCLFTGVMGVACTAMLVAVVTKKLALNKGEKHVHFFMLDIQISKGIRHAAANVLRECWLLHRANLTKGTRGEHRRHQRCLLEAIRVFRHLRLKQRKLRDYVSEMVDLPKMQMIMCDLSANWNNSYRELEQRILSMEQKLEELSRSFQETSKLLSQVLRHRNQEIR
ncbi:intermediate conductance calcium-activated potassium channel protein 4 isoform X5 [Hippocampus zosterae]|uniref:intermediate conductance calcium-activated potassium channel protein 4 isoform X5 n=1 Tax=Hippocampus zosterae TaxID=109293 RepID=UPI00223CD02C|nr:intermediate conductance calcium-activated potassium channel protein 4 isoform X5 [Hippocampus zosterae]